MFAEAAPTAEGEVALQSRPGLESIGSVGSGPINGLFQRDGVLGGARFTLSRRTLYKNATSLGLTTGSGHVSFAATADQLIMTAGAGMYLTEGAGVTQIAFPDSANVLKVGYLAGRFLALREGSDQYYWSDVNDASTWDALSFASAESEPDRLLDLVTYGDYLVLFGSKTVEFHTKSIDPDLPFVAETGRVFDRGIRATGCAVRFDNSVAWVGENNIVYVVGNVPQRISEPGVEERIEASATCTLWSFFFEGHEFLVVRLDSGSWLYDAQTRQWCEFTSWGRVNWRARCAIDGPVFGDDETGTLWRFGDGYLDAGGVLERRFRAGIPLASSEVFNAVRLSANPGRTGALSGQYANPVVEMRSSRDGGAKWTAWRQTSLGEQGKYRTRIEWRRCGQFDDPGALFEFRVTDPEPFRASRVTDDQPSGGRSR